MQQEEQTKNGLDFESICRRLKIDGNDPKKARRAQNINYVIDYN
jgi:hypothetical protein